MTTWDGRVHFVGVGGAGMSAIAKVLVEQEVEVSGSDIKPSPAAAVLEAMGATIRIGHDARLVEGCGAVVVSSAIPPSNPELARARELGVPVLSRGQALSLVLENRRPIVVAGTHGKTTTTSMIVSGLARAGLEPTYLVGGELNDAGTNARLGRGDVTVAEADESDGSFLLLHAHVAVVTNIEADHLDRWGSIEAIRDGFAEWIEGVLAGGSVVLPSVERELIARAAGRGIRVLTFGEGGSVRAEDVLLQRDGSSFTLCIGDERAAAEIRVPGRLNVDNALAAAAACHAVGLTIEQCADGLRAYGGVARRFQKRGTRREVTVIDDYAHHPTEVRRIIDAARAGNPRRVVAVFQPHRYTRTEALWREFGPAFEAADAVVLTDVYAAGEQPIPGVSGKLLAEAVSTSLPGRAIAYLPHRDELVSYLLRACRPGDWVLTMGAGDITSLGDELLARLGGAT